MLESEEGSGMVIGMLEMDSCGRELRFECCVLLWLETEPGTEGRALKGIQFFP